MLFFIIVFVGIFVAVFYLTLILQRIAQRHYRLLQKVTLADEYQVVDLSQDPEGGYTGGLPSLPSRLPSSDGGITAKLIEREDSPSGIDSRPEPSAPPTETTRLMMSDDLASLYDEGIM